MMFYLKVQKGEGNLYVPSLMFGERRYIKIFR